MYEKVPTVLVVGGGSIALDVQKAVPPWRVIEACVNTGAAIARANRSILNLIVLDLSKASDSITTCLQIRTEAPETPILPVTDSLETANLLTRLGCMPPLLRSVPEEVRKDMLHRALDWTTSPLPHDPLIAYTCYLANRLESETRWQRSTQMQVAVLGSSEILRNGLREIVTAAGGAIRFHTTYPVIMRNGLAEAHVALIVADSMAYQEASALAREFRLPLLVVALTTTAGYRALESAQGVLIEPVQYSTMAEALRTLTAGESYYDARLKDPFDSTLLTKTERKIGRLILQEKRLDLIARELSLQPNTLRWHVSNIYAKLGVDSLEAIRAWADSENMHVTK